MSKGICKADLPNSYAESKKKVKKEKGLMCCQQFFVTLQKLLKFSFNSINILQL